MAIINVWIVFTRLNQKKLESHIKVCWNKDFCNVVMPLDNTKMLEFRQYRKSDKVPFITDADI